MWAAEQTAEYWINGIVLTCVAAVGIAGERERYAEPEPEKPCHSVAPGSGS
jgi:hypothetical protein